MNGLANTPEEKLSLGQFFTPIWAAEALVDQFFPDIHLESGIIEPSCGPGAFLSVLPMSVPAVGVEIDPALAEIAARETGRPVIVGDFRTVELPLEPSLLIGNPPFSTDIIDGFYDRAHSILPDGGRMAFILPAYSLQTAGRVAEYSERWSMNTHVIPRNIFPGLSKPLIFTVFTKDRRRVMVGMSLFHEAHEKNTFASPYRQALSESTGQVWKQVCSIALERLGGRADLKAIYAELERNRPTRTQFWREKIRQTLARYTDAFRSLGNGMYAMA